VRDAETAAGDGDGLAVLRDLGRWAGHISAPVRGARNIAPAQPRVQGRFLGRKGAWNVGSATTAEKYAFPPSRPQSRDYMWARREAAPCSSSSSARNARRPSLWTSPTSRAIPCCDAPVA